MSPSKQSRTLSDQQLKDGIEKHVGKTGAIVLRGENHTVADLLAALQQRIDAAKPVAPAKAAWTTAVQNEREVIAETKSLVDDVRKYVALVYGSSPLVLADFGILPKPQRPTTEVKVSAVAKRKATRAARKTMGHRQRAKVKGDAKAAPEPTAPKPT
jgi:hypothetical protein